MYTIYYMGVILAMASLIFGIIIPMGGYVPPNVPNPTADLFSNFGAAPSVPGTGTVTTASNPQNVQKTAAFQGCTIGAGVGLAIAAGGIAFAVLTGGIGTPVAIGAVALGLGGGCGIGGYIGNTFPSSTTQLFNSIVSATGPIGTFLQGIVAAEQYVYPFIQFSLDWLPYEAALSVYEPAFAAVMGLLGIATGMVWFLIIASLFRGTGTL